jgi:hypothetical protein
MIAPVGAAGPMVDVPDGFLAAWELAEVRLRVAESLTCGRVYRAREVDRLRDRLDVTITRAGSDFGGPLEPLILLLEPWDGDRPCGEYRVSAIAATRALDDLEARLPSARAETVQ